MRFSSQAWDGSAFSSKRDPSVVKRIGRAAQFPPRYMMSNYQDICRQFYDNRLLFGDPAEAGIVAVEVVPPGEVEIYRRSHGTLTRERRPLKLFALLAEPGMLNG